MLPVFAFVFVFGLLIGSFLNVCIYRLPGGRSIVSPPSSCPACGSPVRFYDNIPVVSYLVLRGRCRSCGARISPQYPFVEFLNGILYVAVVLRFGMEEPLVTLMYFVFVSALTVIFFIDMKHQIIPNSITLPGIPLGIVLGALLFPDPFARSDALGVRAAVTGAVAGGGAFYLIAVAGKVMLKKDAMGGGDIKMMTMVGGVIGWKGVIVTTFIGSLLGSVTGILLIALKGRQWGARIAFGPFLALGALVTLFFGEEIMAAWLRYLYG
jgi:leader peptidase (prepilin peptidase)/N-methyltransferase